MESTILNDADQRVSDDDPICSVESCKLEPLFSESGRTTRSMIHKCIMLTTGVGLIGVGIVGWIVPLVPGVPLIIAGVALIAIVVPSFARRVNHYEQRLPLSIRLIFRGMRQSEYERQCQVNRFFDS